MFDQKTYRDTVMLPLQKDSVQQSALADTLRGINDAKDDSSRAEALTRTDVASLFAITPGMSDAEIAKHLKSLEAFLNKGRPPVAKTLAQLLKAIKAGFGQACFRSRFWASLAAAGAAANKQKLESFAAAIKQDRPLGVVTAEQLRKAASAHGVGKSVGDKELVAAVATQGVHVCQDFEQPTIRITAAPLKKELHPNYRSIVDVIVLHKNGGRPEEIQVITELSAVVGGAGRSAIAMSDIQHSKSAANKKSDDATESAKKTLNAILNECSTNADLQQLSLAWFLDLADDLVRRQGLMMMPALARLKKAGLADLDAKRILTKASAASSGPDLNSVSKLIVAGDLQSARRTLISLTGENAGREQSPLLKKVTLSLEEAESKKSAYLDAYRAAVAAGDHAKAQQALADAHSVDREDTEIARLLERMPPAAPTGLRGSYSAEQKQLLLSWRGTQDDDVLYSVVRSENGAPANPESGHQITSATSEQRTTDPDPILARPVTYAVFSYRRGTDYSIPAVTHLTVLPPPSDIGTAATLQDVTVFWKAPAEASGVSVKLVSPDGSTKSFPVTTKNRLLIEGLSLGEKYTLSLAAHYVVSGKPAQSETVTVYVTPRGAAHPVEDLRISETSMPDGRPGIRAEWTDVLGYTTDLWSFPIDTKLRVGARVDAGMIDQLTGKKVVGSIRSHDASQIMDFYVMSDVRALYPVTWDGPMGIVGAHVIAGSAPPPKSVEAMRFGSELVVSWVWPHGNYKMNVAWLDGGSSVERRVDRLEYKRDGGFRIPNAGQVTEVSVGTIAIGDRQEHVFAPVKIQLKAALPVLSYSLRLPRGLFGGREAEAAVTSSDFHGSVELVAVLAPGSFMPAKPEDGQEIARLRLDFSTNQTQQATFQVPKIKGPFWVRLFSGSEGQVALQDPPTSSMKG